MNCRISATFAVLLLGLGAAHAQILPSTPGVAVQAGYQRGSSVGIVCFEYTVSNPASNSASVASIDVDISKTPEMAIVTRDGVADGSGVSTAINNEVLHNGKATPTIAVGMSAPPQWSVSLSVDGAVSWVPIIEALKPGTQQSGFQICSHGLPAIRRFFAQPYIDIDDVSIVPPNGTSTDLQRYQSQLKAIEKNSGTTGNTVAPVGPPASFVPSDFLKTIISYKDQAFTMGWISNPGIKTSLDAKLNAALAALNGGNQTEAKNQLNALLNEVSAQAGKQLQTEAVALLQFNTQYLLSQLP